MAAQPLNTSINVFYRVRAQRALNLHRSVWEVGNGAGVNPLVTVVPGQEGSRISATRDAATDIVTTSLAPSRDGGYAVVRYRIDPVSFADTVVDLNTPASTEETFRVVRIGKDAFIEKKAAYASDDLFGQVQDL